MTEQLTEVRKHVAPESLCPKCGTAAHVASSRPTCRYFHCRACGKNFKRNRETIPVETISNKISA